MKKIERSDGWYLRVDNENDKYLINIYSHLGKKVDGYTESFDTEEQAYRVAVIAAKSFTQGQEDMLQRIQD